MKPEAQKQRIEYFDFLRVFATLAVIAIHVSGQHWYDTDVTSLSWQVFNLTDSSVRWGVPVFVMISGALFLGGNRSLKDILKKNVLRMAAAFLFWSGLYAADTAFREGLSLAQTAAVFVSGHYHLWFLYMIVGLYLAVPVLRRITESESTTRYFLLLALVFCGVLPQVEACLKLVSSLWGGVAEDVRDAVQFPVAAGYVFYFVLGYYLHNVQISPRQRKWIYVLGIISLLLTIGLSAGVSVWKDAPKGLFYKNYTVNVACISGAVFVLGKHRLRYDGLPEWTVCLLKRLSRYSFGAYLVHVWVLETLERCIGLNTLSFHPLLSVPAIVLLTAAVSFAVSGILNRIPLLGKYIV